MSRFPNGAPVRYQSNSPVVIGTFNRVFLPEEVLGKLKIVDFIKSQNPTTETLTATRYVGDIIYFDSLGASPLVQLKASGRDLIANFAPGILHDGYICDFDFKEQHKREADINGAMYLMTQPKLSELSIRDKYPIVGFGVQQGTIISKLTYLTGNVTAGWLNNIELDAPSYDLFLSHESVDVMVNVLREILAMEYTNELDVDSIDSEQVPTVDGGTLNVLTD